ncbi:hypothetical protein [Thauera butanivorans]|uniref:hypothetical protein n=1 Tax=Thauera butanivorans TaxID=86174 RepID=UPI000A4049A7|nr:hypothetical protein [Thauera butanivorans]
MSQEERDFLAGAAATLGESVGQLERLAQELSEKLGDERVNIVRGLLEQVYDRDDEAEVRASLCYTERKLLWAWVRLKRLKGLRLSIGRGSMRNII